MAITQVKTKLIKGFWSALDWIYPPACAVCGMPGYPLCADCANDIQYITGRVCPLCGAPNHHKLTLCDDCRDHMPKFEAARSLAIYGGVIRECIHSLKYKNNRSLGKYFAGYLLPIVIKEEWQIDLVVPVPLSKERYRERGYNQAAAVAHPLALFLERPYQPFCLEQVRDTRSQVGLSADERRINVVGAFKAVPELVRKKDILLIDDVKTTGATLSACAGALKKAGAGNVFCVTIARFSG